MSQGFLAYLAMGLRGSCRPNDTAAPTGSPSTGSDPPNDTTPTTGSDEIIQTSNTPVSGSRCEPFRDVISSKLAVGLDGQRIFQDLVHEHGFEHK